MERRSSLVGGALLVLLGAAFLARMWMPNVLELTWPVYILGLGFVFLVAAVLSRVGALAIPGCIISGIGGILYYQNQTGNWETWAYVWTLIPGFVGIGMVLSSLLTPGSRLDHSGWFLVGISALGFIIFSGITVLDTNLFKFWPVLLILAGLSIALRTLKGRDKRP